jgi:peptidoglycan/xylan/chitin deacetylase (PgdA/CDA1 family)
MLKFIDICGINNLFRFFNRHKVIILWYHGICEDTFRLLSGYDERHIQKSKFREQLSFLKRRGYNFLNMSEFIDILHNKKRIYKMVVLTFDDGYRNVVTNAYPIMKEFNAKGCFYLISGLIDEGKLLWTDYIETIVRNFNRGKFTFIFKGEKIFYTLDDKKSYEATMLDIKNKLRTLPELERIEHLKQFDNKNITDFPKEFIFANWAQIQSLDRKILEIGSHTKHHPNLTNISSSEGVMAEIKNSKVKIEKKVGYEINYFCYPAGKYNEDIVKKVKECRYSSAVTIKHGFNDESTNLYKLNRIEAPEDFLLFKSSISGSYFVMKWIKKLFHRNNDECQ